MRRLVLAAVLAAALWAQSRPPDKPDPPAGSKPSDADATVKSRRTELNLLGQVDAEGGESRRNENVQFNLVDNNALKELNVRLGVTATIIQEFRPERNYFGAEFGNSPPAVLHLSDAARRAMHGSLYETHQNSIFSARSFFQAGEVKPAHENNYGFTFGASPASRTHLYLAGSQQQLRGSVNGNVLVPRPDERTPLASDAATRAVVERFLAAYPRELPNRTDINPRALNTNAPQSINSDNAEIRADQELGARDRLAAQYVFTSQIVDAFQLVAGQNPDTHTLAHAARFTWRREWDAGTTTSFSAGFDRIGSVLAPEQNAVGPMVSIGGLQTLGPEGSIPINRAQNHFRSGGILGATKGAHRWTAGFDLLRRQFNGVETDAHRGFFGFTNDFGRDSITNLRLGLPTQYIIAIGEMHRGFRNWDMQYYAGDQWRVRQDLVLTYSLRYAPVTKPVEVNHRNVIPYPCDCNNVAPQFGFAWRLPARWGTLRGAYGLHYGEIFPVTFQQVRFAPPGNYKIVAPNPNLVNPLPEFHPGADPNILPTTYVLDNNLRSPYSHQYNFSWEAALPGNWKLQAGYGGSRSHKLLTMWYLNRAHPVPGIPQTTGTVNIRRADPHFAEIRRVINGSRGYFDAARVSLVLPRWRGLSMDAAYWFSKALDLGSSYSNTAYDNDSRLSRSQSEGLVHQDMKGRSSFDQPHALLWRAAYSAPPLSGRLRRVLGGWTLAAVTVLKQGTPFDVVTGSDSPGYGNVDGNGGDRPNLLDPSVLGRTIGNPDTSSRLLPRSAFALMQPTDERGNLGHNVLRKGGIRNLNAFVSRSWSLGGDRSLLWRAESINLFNTPQFAAPGNELASANFGFITNTLNDGRAFRLLARFSW